MARALPAVHGTANPPANQEEQFLQEVRDAGAPLTEELGLLGAKIQFEEKFTEEQQKSEEVLQETEAKDSIHHESNETGFIRKSR